LAEVRASPAGQRPNIFWIFIDDQDPWWGCYGNPLVKTPHLDKLAREGRLYRQTFVANPVCSPSHTALFTGNYPTTLGCPDHRSLYLRNLPAGHFCVEELLRQAGYFTVSLIGDGDSPSKLGHNRATLIEGASGKTDLNYRRAHPPSPFEYAHYLDPMDTTTFFSGGAWEKRLSGQPFFAYANIETGKAYAFKAGRRWARQNGAGVDPGAVSVPPYLPDTAEQRDLIAMIHETVSHTDAVVGRFLDALEQAGFQDDTFVFVASDHGRATFRHKQWLYDTGTHVPMILRWPGHLPPGSECNELTSLIDVAPTTLAVAGVKIPPTMEGLNLLDANLAARTAIFASRDGVDGTFDQSRMIRTRHYKFIRNFYPELPYINGNYARSRLRDQDLVALFEAGKLTPAQAAFLQPDKPAEELYDVEADPFEVQNLAENPEYASIRDELSARLEAHRQATEDRAWDAREALGVEKLAPGTSVYAIAHALVKQGELSLDKYDEQEVRKVMKAKVPLRRNGNRKPPE
jgi:arylsulfatase A-like enzyme